MTKARTPGSSGASVAAHDVSTIRPNDTNVRRPLLLAPIRLACALAMRRSSGFPPGLRIAVGGDQRVTRGDVIGYVGSTGRSTGSHLHYEIWMSGRLTDPMTLLAR